MRGLAMQADKLLAAIDEAIAKDNGATFRRLLGEEILKCTDAFDGSGEDNHSILGVSNIGNECARAVAYSWLKASEKSISPRLYRLFNRGHLEEARFIALLRAAGCQVWSHGKDGRQIGFKQIDGHYGTVIDGVVKGIPEMPETPLLAEFKTHADKSFTGLLAKGLIQAKPMHYAQMQQAMGILKIHHGLYMAVNKNNDALYAEIIEFDQANFEHHFERAKNIITIRELPPKVSTKASGYPCTYCDHNSVCHDSEAPIKHCRSCVNVGLSDNGGWFCSLTKPAASLTLDQQKAACNHYEVDKIF
jgi:hypothetical protein